MNKTLTYTLLALLIIGVFGMRAWYSFAVPGLSSDESYWHLRNAENILKTGLPLFHDPLAWGGRTDVFSPLFDYLLALLGLFIPLMTAAKLLSALLAAALVPATFALCHRVSNSNAAGILCASLFALTPAFIQTTLNQLTPFSLLIILVVAALYALLRIHEEHWLSWYVITLALASFTHPASIIIPAGLIICLGLALIRNKRVEQTLLEVTLFSTFFFVWSQFLIFKKVLFQDGLSIVQAIMPASTTQTASLAIMLGTIPLLAGTYLTWKELFNTEHPGVFLPVGLSIAIASLILSGILHPLSGATLLIIPLLTLFSSGCAQLKEWLHTTRIAPHANLTLALLAVFTLALSAGSGFTATTHALGTFPADEQTAMEWIRTHTEPNVRIAALSEEGQRIAAISERSTFIDTRTLGRADAKQRKQDLRRLLTATTQLEALEILNQYEIDYLYLSPNVLAFTGTPLPTFLSSTTCFSLVYDAGPRIYQKSRACQVKTHT